MVRSEPYRLAADVWGIGFKTADTIAAAVGIAADSPERIKAGLAYTLSEAADDGHCYLPAPNLIADAAKILDVPADADRPVPGRAGRGRRSVRETVPASARCRRRQAAPQVPAVYLPPFHQAERSLAARPAPPARRPGGPAERVRGRGLGQGAGLAAAADRRRSSPRNRPTRSGWP